MAIAPRPIKPGHHQTALQALPKTLGLKQDEVIVLDALRKQRNLSDYEGDPITEAAVVECVKQAESLIRHAQLWLHKYRSDLV